MDENADIYYVDTRNADHRTSRPGSGGRIPVGWGGAAALRPPMVYPAQYPQPATMYPQPMVYGPAPAASTFASSLFGKLTTGEVIELVATVFASLQPLPASPSATKDTPTDVGNLMVYQGALAQHAKRDEQVRMIGGLLAKLVG